MLLLRHLAGPVLFLVAELAASLLLVQPATVLAWHRQGFRRYWRWKPRSNPVGRPRLEAPMRELTRRMARENPTWGRRRIQAELALLGTTSPKRRSPRVKNLIGPTFPIL